MALVEGWVGESIGGGSRDRGGDEGGAAGSSGGGYGSDEEFGGNDHSLLFSYLLFCLIPFLPLYICKFGIFVIE